MVKPKEWLLKNGHIKEITRGRMSRENIQRIEDAVRKGEQIEGFMVSTVQPKTAEKDAPKKVDKVSVSTDRVLDIPDESRDERAMSAYALVNGKNHPIGMRTVCNACHSSLTYCHCESPRVWLDTNTEVVVLFKSIPSSRKG